MDTIKINIETNAEQASKSFEDLAQSFNSTDKQAIDLRKEIRALKADLYTLTPGTEEYANAIQQLGAKMNQLSDTQQELRVATGGLDTVFQSSTQAVASFAGGFQAAVGVVTLFGAKSEDLQKAFVKLQAIMSITTGLKGFAAFPKMAKRAMISLAAFLNQTNATTAGLNTMAVSEKVAAKSTNTLTAAFKKLTAAMASNPIGLVVLALAGLATAFVTTAKKQNEAKERFDAYNEAVGKAPTKIRTAQEALDDYLDSLDMLMEKLQALGISQERRQQTELELLEEEKEEQEKLKAAAEERANELMAEIDAIEQNIESQVDNFDELDVALATLPQSYEKQSQELHKMQQAAIDASVAIDGLEKQIISIRNVIDPPIVKELNKELSALSDEFTVKMAGGLATQGDYLQAQIDVYRKARNDLWTAGNTHVGPRIKGDTQQEQIGNRELSVKFDAEIHALEVQLKAYNAGVDKKTRDSAQQLADKIRQNYDKLINEITEDAGEIKTAWEKALSEFKASDILPQEEIGGRMTAQMFRYQSDIETYLDNWRKLGEKAKKEIGEKNFNKFIKFLDDLGSSLSQGLDVQFKDLNISETVINEGKRIQETVSTLKKDNEAMLNALSGGLISKEEYGQWIANKMQEYRALLNEEVETSNDTEAAFIRASKDIIPPSVKAQMEAAVSEYYNDIIKEIDKGFNNLEMKYERDLERFNDKMTALNRTWLEGGGNTDESLGGFFSRYFGLSPTKSYRLAQEQAEGIYKILYEEYNKEKQLLEEKMALLDKTSEEYKKYEETVEQINYNLAQAEDQYRASNIANIRQHAEDIKNVTSDFIDSIGGLASAMSSYYAEQAEQAKETYGESSEEYRKYVEKEGTMKIAQVWSDAAMGIMTAWATSESLGPILGPVMAAIQTAALIATATASTQQIRRQTKSTASGNAPANVGQLTDRVIMADAQRTDQTAQLNAQYNQGATRVYVTQGDIQDANNENRVAVTQNKF